MRFRLFPTLAALFIGIPLLDMVLLVFLGGRLGFWPTVGLVILSGLAGASLAKAQGLRVWHNLQREMSTGQVPSQGLMDAVIILVAGGMLTAPGFVTDILGLALLVPQVRVPIKNFLRRRVETALVRTQVPWP